MYLFHFPARTSAYGMGARRFFISHVTIGIAFRAAAFVSANPWKPVDQSAYQAMMLGRFPTRVVQASHAFIPVFPSGAPSIDTPVRIPAAGGAIARLGAGAAWGAATRSGE